MIKDPESPYTPGRRGKSWLKLKRALATLDALGAPGEPAGLRAARFELALLRELGYNPVLEACAVCGGPIAPSTGIGMYAATIGGPLLPVHSGIPCASGFGREFHWLPLSALPTLLRQSPRRAKQRRKAAA